MGVCVQKIIYTVFLLIKLDFFKIIFYVDFLLIFDLLICIIFLVFSLRFNSVNVESNNFRKEVRYLTKNTEELILQELFNLNHKIDKFQIDTQEEFKAIRAQMATKEDLKRFAIKEDIKKLLTKEEFKQEMNAQVKDIAQIFHDTFNTLEKRENKLRIELL